MQQHRKASLRTQHVLGDERVAKLFTFYNTLGPVNGRVPVEKCKEVLGNLGNSGELPVEHIIMSRRALEQQTYLESDRDEEDEEEFDGTVRAVEFLHFFVHVAGVFSIEEVDERMAQLGLRNITTQETDEQQSAHERRKSRRRQSSKTSKGLQSRALGEGRLQALGEMFDALPSAANGSASLEDCEQRFGGTFRRVLKTRRLSFEMSGDEFNLEESEKVTRTEWLNYFVELSLVKGTEVVDRMLADERASRASERGSSQRTSERSAEAPAAAVVPAGADPRPDRTNEHVATPPAEPSFTASFSSISSSEALPPGTASPPRAAAPSKPKTVLSPRNSPRPKTGFCIVL